MIKPDSVRLCPAKTKSGKKFWIARGCFDSTSQKIKDVAKEELSNIIKIGDELYSYHDLFQHHPDYQDYLDNIACELERQTDAPVVQCLNCDHIEDDEDVIFDDDYDPFSCGNCGERIDNIDLPDNIFE